MHIAFRALVLFGVLWATGCARPIQQKTGLLFQTDVSGSWVSEEAGEPHLMRAFGAAARIHYQGERWGVGVSNEANLFRVRTIEDDWDRMATALFGVDVSLLSAKGRLRHMISGGSAVLLEGTSIDKPGSIGFFIDSRPVIFRFQVGRETVLAFAPLSGMIVVPDPSGIPIVDAQFRANLAVEFF